MNLYPKIEKFIGAANVSRKGAFAVGESVQFRVTVPRGLGSLAPVLKIGADGEEERDIELSFATTDWTNDTYETTVVLSDFTEGRDGLLFYTFVFECADGVYFANSENNVDFELSNEDDSRFFMLVYLSSMETPDWAGNGVMYQIFVDRFRRGEGECSLRDDCVLNEDWDNGVPQYGERAGSYVENNEFFGGNLYGITQKLDYLESLGVTVIYLCPVFEAKSNHKYDIGDYLKIDSCFGGERALDELIQKAKEKGIRIILDGVFNHTGDDSRYFDKYARYGGGALSDENSEYRSWYTFKNYPDDYESWWGIPIMPRLNHENETCRRFFTGEGGVAVRYLEKGIGGWRLDVADELNDAFLDEFRSAVKSKNPDAVIIGEVWENAATKISYGKRRKYFRGEQLDSVMNYPLRNGIISFVKNGDAKTLYNVLTEIYSSYPASVCACLMNIIGTHDTERILTVLGGEEDLGFDNATLAVKKMSVQNREKAIGLLKIASAIQYTAYGIPSLYYGDEAGIEGYHDPFCRLPYPWGRECEVLIEHYKKLGHMRKEHKALQRGEFEMLDCRDNFIAYVRYEDTNKALRDEIICAANRSDNAEELKIKGTWRDILSGECFTDRVVVLPDTAVILEKMPEKKAQGGKNVRKKK